MRHDHVADVTLKAAYEPEARPRIPALNPTKHTAIEW